MNHYLNAKIFTVNLNFLFDDKLKDRIIEKLSEFTLRKNIMTFQAENVPILHQRNLENLTRSGLLKNIRNLKLPGNNLGNLGASFIFSCENLRHIKKIDLSSNNIDLEGARYISNNNKLSYLEVIDLRLNKIGDEGFKELIKSEKLSKIRDLRLDMNKITFNGTV